MSQPEMHIPPKYEEEYIAKLPALTLMANMGWRFLSPQQALDFRHGKQDQVVLREECAVCANPAFSLRGQSASAF